MQVSKRWRDFLWSQNVLDGRNSKWYTPSDPPLRGENAAAGLSEYEKAKLKFEHAARLRIGRPFSEATYQFPGSLSLPTAFVLSRETVAWTEGEFERPPWAPNGGYRPNRVGTRNLRTGDIRHFGGSGRETIMELALTEEILAFSTFNGWECCFLPICGC